MTAFPERLRAVMGARRITRKALAQECGVSVQLAQKWIDGRGTPNAERLATICRVCDCSEAWLTCPFPMDWHAVDGPPTRADVRQWVRDELDAMRGMRHD